MDLNRSRRARTEVSLRELATQIPRWLEMRRKADLRRQHATQLAAIETLLTKILTRLRADADALESKGSGSALHLAAAGIDKRIAWLERVWTFLRTRFDQRDDPRLADMLAAADEVVWSCYEAVLNRAAALGLSIGPRMPAPLPFVEARYSPEAFPSEMVPPELRGEVEVEVLREYLNRMPISVVRVPSACVPAPWWLVLLGHEVGHHVQYDMLPDRGLVTGFREHLRQAVMRSTNSELQAKRWADWSVEVFADLFSVLFVGPWAVRAMLELELANAAAFDEPRDRYPSPAMRLRLLARAADRVYGERCGSVILESVVEIKGSDSPTEAVIDAVLTAGLGPLPGLGAGLTELCDTDPISYLAQVASWSESLRAGNERPPEAAIQTARIVVSAAFDAWNDVAGSIIGDALHYTRDQLACLSLRALRNGAPEGERGGDGSAIPDHLIGAAVEAIWEAST